MGKKKTIFAQDDVTDAVFHIEKGEVKLTVASSSGKEATIGILGDGDIFGEGYSGGQPVCTGSASAMIKCEILRIGKKAMMLALHREHKLSGLFVAYLLARNIRDREDLVGQLFNSSGKTIGEDSSVVGALRHERVSQTVVPGISQTKLAETAGTTRSRVNFFMHRFPESGLIPTDGATCRSASPQFPA